jgi:nickel transport protein
MRTCLITILLLLFSTVPVQAHRVNIFAWVEDGSVYGEASFSGGKPAVNSEVAVIDAATGEELLTTMTDKAGNFEFELPESAKKRGNDLEVMLKAGMGHQDDWTIRAEEYGAIPDEEAKSRNDSPSSRKALGVKAEPEKLTQKLSALQESVQSMEKRLGEISRSLAELKEAGPDLSDVLGGIGYILGLAGVAAYVRSRLK